MRHQRAYRPGLDVNLEVRLTPSQVWTAPPITIPQERTDPYGVTRHQQNLAKAYIGAANVAFIGDSITDWWGDSERLMNGGVSWRKTIAPLGAANFGIASDTTQNVLWRVTHGEMAGQPKVVVLQIGANDLRSLGKSVAETTRGIIDIVSAIHVASPGSKILVVGVFPQDKGVTDPVTLKAKSVNRLLAQVSSTARFRFIDIGSGFLNRDGTINSALMPGGLHPSALGYEYWGHAIVGPLRTMLT